MSSILMFSETGTEKRTPDGGRGKRSNLTLIIMIGRALRISSKPHGVLKTDGARRFLNVHEYVSK